ncbi:hypothetical protein IMZ31_24185 (plasmid) [Pontibacillus sp. ALD_SL1]|uniref:hypothetical protein n=1 Tax=Pontibacillus sp. ALD_SL1 TaxID=2777185 RepID=UPI001A970060|nr:hypothetical protein [Pontibacillus sp. ALD_SL1]QST02552.1 hypothetical protein IMZ31_24185 [Pontibacillus sp. ALD_SL1]
MFAVQVMNHLKGSHHLVLFEKQEHAETFRDTLDALWRGEVENAEDWRDEDYNEAYSQAYGDAVTETDDLDWRKIEETMNISFSVNINGTVTPQTDDVHVINANDHVYIPA